MKIRPYQEKDFDDVRYICLNSDGPCDMTKCGRRYILTTYCDYYIEQEGENCFVAVDENDKAVGYVICAENFDRFKEMFVSEYLPRFKKYEYARRKSALQSIDPQERYKAEYPAHLHIDVLPEYQRMGLGGKMTAALCEHLKKKGVKGVMLTVWSGNEKGRGFYNKFGFTQLETVETTVAYGLKLL